MIIKIMCDEKDCLNYKEIEWDGEFIENWYCDEHRDIQKREK
jgi:hypothetical protein